VLPRKKDTATKPSKLVKRKIDARLIGRSTKEEEGKEEIPRAWRKRGGKSTRERKANDSSSRREKRRGPPLRHRGERHDLLLRGAPAKKRDDHNGEEMKPFAKGRKRYRSSHQRFPAVGEEERYEAGKDQSDFQRGRSARSHGTSSIIKQEGTHRGRLYQKGLTFSHSGEDFGKIAMREDASPSLRGGREGSCAETEKRGVLELQPRTWADRLMLRCNRASFFVNRPKGEGGKSSSREPTKQTLEGRPSTGARQVQDSSFRGRGRSTGRKTDKKNLKNKYRHYEESCSRMTITKGKILRRKEEKRRVWSSTGSRRDFKRGLRRAAQKGTEAGEGS